MLITPTCASFASNASFANNATGTIVGTAGVAVQFDGGVNTLTFNTGSALTGSIDGGTGAGLINITGTGAVAVVPKGSFLAPETFKIVHAMDGDSAQVGFGLATALFANTLIYVHHDADLASGSSNAITAGVRFSW